MAEAATDELHGLQLLRVKRRREDAAADHLIIQQPVSLTSVLESSKRQRKARQDTAAQSAEQVANQLSSALDLNQGTSAGEDKPSEPAPEADVGQKQVTRRRYVRVHTLHKDALQGVSADDIRKLISSWKTAGQNGTAATLATEPKAQPASATTSSPQPSTQQQPKLHYTLVGSKRPSSKVFGTAQSTLDATGAASTSADPPAPASSSPAPPGDRQDALGDVVRVFDLHAHNPDHVMKRQRGIPDPVPPAAGAGAHGAGVSSAQPGAGLGQDTSAGSMDLEALLKAHFMPMLDEVVLQAGYDLKMAEPTQAAPDSAQGAGHQRGSKGFKAPSARRTRAAARDDSHVQQEPQAGAGVTQDQTGPEMSDGESEIVYDVYVPVEEAMCDGQDGDQDEREEDASIPVIEVPDSDDELWWAVGADGCADPDHDWLQHDSEDSNAESYYANTYPDECDERDGDAQYFDPWEQEDDGRVQGGSWGDEEWDVNDYDSSDEELDRAAGGNVVERSRLAAQGFLKAALARHEKSVKRGDVMRG